MANAMVQASGAPNLPAHIAKRMASRQNIPSQETVPSLTFEGRTWSININGEKTPMLREIDGEMVPASVMRVVVLDWAKTRGRALYAKVDEDGVFRFTTFDPKKTGRPLCWSDDGVKADKTIAARPFKGWTGTCDGCPMSIKGSRISDNGKPGAGCSQHRMIAVVPHARPNSAPLRMKLAITSDWDGQSPDLSAQGWFAFKNFMTDLRNKGYTDTATFVTKMKFDPNVTYPKVMFSYDRWLTEAEDAVIGPLAESDAVKTLLAGTWTPAGSDGARKEVVDEEVMDEAAEPRLVTAEDRKTRVMPRALKVEQTPKPQEAPPRQCMDDDDDDDMPAPAPAKVAKPPKAPVPRKAAPVTPSREIPAAVAAIIGEWDPDPDEAE